VNHAVELRGIFWRADQPVRTLLPRRRRLCLEIDAVDCKARVACPIFTEKGVRVDKQVLLRSARITRAVLALWEP